jgi:hypothetical protein
MKRVLDLFDWLLTMLWFLLFVAAEGAFIYGLYKLLGVI